MSGYSEEQLANLLKNATAINKTSIGGKGRVKVTETTPNKPQEFVRTAAPQTSTLASSEYSTLTFLPSNFIDYQFKSIHIKKFSIQDLLLIYESEQNDSTEEVVRAISNTLHGVNAMELTEGDFWFLMMWQRLNSYKRTPFVVKWYCKNHDHIHKVASDELTQETLYNEDLIQRNKLEEIILDQEAIKKVYDYFITEYGIKLQIPKMRSIIERELEEDNSSEVESIDKLKLLNKLAVYISDEHAISLQEKRDFLLSVKDVDFICDLELVKNSFSHGVSESYSVSCKECGASQETKVSLDARRFLPYSF